MEQVGLWALEQLGLPALLAELGVNRALRAAAAGAIVGRLGAEQRMEARFNELKADLGTAKTELKADLGATVAEQKALGARMHTLEDPDGEARRLA